MRATAGRMYAPSPAPIRNMSPRHFTPRFSPRGEMSQLVLYRATPKRYSYRGGVAGYYLLRDISFQSPFLVSAGTTVPLPLQVVLLKAGGKEKG